MKRFISVVFCLALFFITQGSQCIKTPPSEETTPESPLPVIDNPDQADKLNFALNKESGTIGLKFNTSYFPDNAHFIEVIFDGVYQGYFPANDTIYIPSFTGKKQIIVLLSDAKGNKLSDTRTYWIKL